MNTDLYITASSFGIDNGKVQANTVLPLPIDVSKRDYEIRIIYVSLIPSWIRHLDYYIKHYDDEGTPYYTNFVVQPYQDRDETLTKMRDFCTQKYTNNLEKAPIRFLIVNGDWYLRLAKKSEIELSDSLSEILGLRKKLVNSSNVVRDFVVNFRAYNPHLENSLYYISCNQCQSNFVNNLGSQGKVLDFLHIPHISNDKIIEHFPVNSNYVRLEGCHLNHLLFTLLNKSGEPVYSTKNNFILHCHIRAKNV